MTIPVADDEALESHAALEHVREQLAIAVHFLALPAGVGRHHRQHAGIDRADIALGMEPYQLAFGNLRVALVHAVGRAAVAEEMLGGGCDLPGLQLACEFRRALQTFDGGLCVLTHERRVLSEALVAAAPANILRHGERRRESPVDARRCDRFGGGRADAAHELGVMRGAETDVVRKDHCADDVAVSVHGIDAEQQRNGRVPGRGSSATARNVRDNCSHTAAGARSSPFGPDPPPARIEPSG